VADKKRPTRKEYTDDLVDTANMPMPTLDDIKQGFSDMGSMANQAKMKALDALRGKSMQQMSPTPMMPPDTIGKAQALGAMAIEKSKAESKMNDKNRLQGEVSNLEDLAAFGDKDAELELAAKKEALMKYMNNR